VFRFKRFYTRLQTAGGQPDACGHQDDSILTAANYSSYELHGKRVTYSFKINKYLLRCFKQVLTAGLLAGIAHF
jgi:hypothetical protein